MGEDDRSLDTDFENVYEPESASDGAEPDAGGEEETALTWTTASTGGGGFDDDLSVLENVPAEATTLRDHLIGQVNIEFDDPVDLMIADRLIDILDDNGWLSGELETVAVALGCTIERIEETLARCQRLDPPGIFGRTLAECLALQLREKDRLDPAMEALLKNLDLLGKREFVQLRRICGGVDNEDLLQMVAEIKGSTRGLRPISIARCCNRWCPTWSNGPRRAGQ